MLNIDWLKSHFIYSNMHGVFSFSSLFLVDSHKIECCTHGHNEFLCARIYANGTLNGNSSSIQENWRKRIRKKRHIKVERERKRNREKCYFDDEEEKNSGVYVFPFIPISIHSSVAITDNGLCILPCIYVLLQTKPNNINNNSGNSNRNYGVNKNIYRKKHAHSLLLTSII